MKNTINFPKVCICIPAYNAEATIGETLNSLVNQTYKNISIYVIDNNSKDRTVEVVEKFVKKYEIIKLFKYDKSVPADENFDRCITHSDGEYTCIFHSDDVYLSTIVEKEVKFLLKDKTVGAVFAFANIINEKNDIISEILPNKKLLEKETYNFIELMPIFLKYNNFFVTPSAMVRTEIYKEEIIKHKRNVSFGDAFDVDVWFRILKTHKVGFLYEKLLNYRLSIHSTSFRKLLLYKNTVADGMFNVLEYNIREEHLEEILSDKDYVNLKTKNLLVNVYHAYVSGDYNYSRSIMNNINTKNCRIKIKAISLIFKIMLIFKLPLILRKIMIFIKYRKILKGQFSKISI